MSLEEKVIEMSVSKKRRIALGCGLLAIAIYVIGYICTRNGLVLQIYNETEQDISGLYITCGSAEDKQIIPTIRKGQHTKVQYNQDQYSETAVWISYYDKNQEEQTYLLVGYMEKNQAILSRITITNVDDSGVLQIKEKQLLDF